LGFAFALVPPSREASLDWVEKGLTMAASIVFITGAGGAFGAVLRETGMGTYLGEALSGYQLWLLLPFMISALLKTAQGSSTVALITTPTIVGPVLPSLGLTSPVGLALTVLAIGAGAMVVSHVNDSYFWVVTKLTGIEDVSIGYRTQTMATLVEGTAAMAVVLVLGAILL
jgi:GntP family gluconate:H+ symporter